MIDIADLRTYLIRPVLEHIGLYSESAQELLVGTYLHESVVGGVTHLQQEKGPAQGIFQIEPPTFFDCYRWLTGGQGKIPVQAVKDLTTPWPALVDQMRTNLPFQIAIARIKYYRDPGPLPSADDVDSLAATWKRVWNTNLGAGTVSEFVAAYVNGTAEA